MCNGETKREKCDGQTDGKTEGWTHDKPQSPSHVLRSDREHKNTFISPFSVYSFEYHDISTE